MTLHRRELQIMKIIWKKGQATVRDIYQTLLKGEQIAYTTVATILKNMERKGIVGHEVVGRTYVYKPLITEEEVSQSMLRDLLDRLFDGSTEMLLSTLVKVQGLSRGELEELWQRISSYEEEE